MRLGKRVTGLAMGALLLGIWPALGSPDSAQFFPLRDVRPGLKGYGLTIFSGNQIDKFQVEVLGVLKNAIAPKHDVILARLSGGPLASTGVIAGMSGSPVYIEGKLLGAVALSFQFSKEPIAGITPIGEMLDVVPGGSPSPQSAAASNLAGRFVRDSSGDTGSLRLIPGPLEQLPFAVSNPEQNAPSGPLAGLRLPLSFGGFSAAAVQSALPLFHQMGFEPMQGGSLSGGPATGDESEKPADASQLLPGSMVSVLLVRGDLNLNVDCTVTYRDGDKLYACGHRFMLTGPVDFPLATSHVLASVPSLASSFKLDEPGSLVGAIHQDRFGAIYGVVGDKAKLIPVHIQVDSSLNRKEEYDFSVVQESFLTPVLLNLGLVSTLSSTERGLGASTLELTGKIRLSGGETVDLGDVISGDFNTNALAGMQVATPVSYVLANNFPNGKVEGVDLSIVSRNEKRMATLEQVWSTKSEVHPGDRFEVTALLRTSWGENVLQKIPVTIPESVRDKTVSLVVGGGSSINALQSQLMAQTASPRDLHQLVHALNRMRRNNRVYALLMAPQRSFVLQGDEYSSPPPSLLQTVMADPAISGNVIFSGTSVVGDFEAPPSPFAIQGQKTILLKVVDAGS